MENEKNEIWIPLGKAYIKCRKCGHCLPVPSLFRNIGEQEDYRPSYCERCGEGKVKPNIEEVFIERIREAYDKGMQQGIRYTYDKAKEESIRTVERFIKDYKDGAYGVMQGVREKPLSTDEILELLLKAVKDN